LELEKKDSSKCPPKSQRKTLRTMISSNKYRRNTEKKRYEKISNLLRPSRIKSLDSMKSLRKKRHQDPELIMMESKISGTKEPTIFSLLTSDWRRNYKSGNLYSNYFYINLISYSYCI
jgi:hypothetical protein